MQQYVAIVMSRVKVETIREKGDILIRRKFLSLEMYLLTCQNPLCKKKCESILGDVQYRLQ